MLPNLIIIGAMKCGTVSLHKYLSLHPEINMAPIDEIDFFVEERNWSKGLDWYQAIFQQQAPVVGERSTAYAKYPLFYGVPQRIHNLIPDAKLIFCVRDPVERGLSHYVHEVAQGRETRPVEDVLGESQFRNQYAYLGQYFLQISQYLEYFDLQNILIVHLEDMARRRRESLKRVFEFLDVDPNFEHEAFDRAHHKASDLRRKTWFKNNFGQMRGMVRLERLIPNLFEQSVQKPILSESFRKRFADVFIEDAAQFAAVERNLPWPATA